MKIVGIAGSLRRDSLNKKLLRHAASVLADLGVTLEIFDLADIPLFNEDIERPKMPSAVEQFRVKVAEADALVICTPEYNSSIPGVLKNAIDWGSRPPKNAWDGKACAIMGATPGGFGTVQASRDLRHVLTILNVTLVPYPPVYLSKATGAFDESGALTDVAAAAKVEQLLKRLLDVTAALSSLKKP